MEPVGEERAYLVGDFQSEETKSKGCEESVGSTGPRSNKETTEVEGKRVKKGGRRN